ncbi:hypothetical protein KY328_00040 [Candidatus Woesearchaeota archaeon]|nr:hypothetical protein [Candidatus Woesearchaeota archaeon]
MKRTVRPLLFGAALVGAYLHGYNTGSTDQYVAGESEKMNPSELYITEAPKTTIVDDFTNEVRAQWQELRSGLESNDRKLTRLIWEQRACKK